MSSREQPNRNRWTLLPPGPPHKLPRRPGTTPGLHIAGHILSLDTLSQRRSPHHSRTLPPTVHRARTKAVGSSHGTDPPRTGKLGSKIHSGLSQRGDRRPRRRLIRKAHEQATKTRRSPVTQRGSKPERAGLSPGKTVEPAASSSGSVHKFQEILHNDSELKRIHCAKQSPTHGGADRDDQRGGRLRRRHASPASSTQQGRPDNRSGLTLFQSGRP